MSMVTKFVIWSVLLLVVVGLTFGISANNNQNVTTHDWSYWQNQYKDIAMNLATDPAVKEATRTRAVEVNNVTVMQFPLMQQDGSTQMRVDRCQSCHSGLLNPQMTAENIIRAVDHQTIPTEQVASYLDSHPKTLQLIKVLGTHPGVDVQRNNAHSLGVIHSLKYTYGVATERSLNNADKQQYAVDNLNISKHPFATFGCTTCHYGSGRDLAQDAAHGDPERWMQPMLAVKNMDAACAQCHINYNKSNYSFEYHKPVTVNVDGKPRTVPLMQNIVRGEKLFKDMACYGCHKIEGFSKGNVGPELTFEGRIAVPSTIEHQLWDPRYKVGSCVMPYFFSVRQRNTDMPDEAGRSRLVDPRARKTMKLGPQDQWALNLSPDAPAVTPATVSEEIGETLATHGYIPDEFHRRDVDDLVTFVASQTGSNYSVGQADRIAMLSAYNTAVPPTVPVTAEEGRRLFYSSGCTACHYVRTKNILGDPMTLPLDAGMGGVAGPELTWVGSRHSLDWMVKHYENPQAFVPGSIMPIFPFSDSQRKALSLFDQSQRGFSNTAQPVSSKLDMPADALIKAGAQTPDIRYMTR